MKINNEEDIVKYLTSNYSIYGQRNGVVIDGDRYPLEKLKLLIYSKLAVHLGCFNDVEASLLKTYNLCKALKKPSEDGEVNIEEELRLLGNLNLGIDSFSGNLILFHKDTYGVVNDISVDGVLCKLSPKTQTYLKKKAPIVIQYFNPYASTEPKVYEEHPTLHMPAIELNQYIPPSYIVEDAVPRISSKVKSFLEFFFPVEESREYVYDWIHNLLLTKNETILYLVGTQGTGKNVLAEQILAKLIGEEYQHTSEQKVSEAKFNGFLSNKQLFFLDEFTAKNDSGLNYIKKMTNRKVTIQAKFKEARMRDSYLSLIIANNEMNAVRLKTGDRRISVPDIADIRIDKVLGKDFIPEMIKELEDPETLAELRAFFIHRKPKYNGVQPYQKDRFLECCVKSLGTYMSYIYDILLELRNKEAKTHVTYNELLSHYKNRAGMDKKPNRYPNPITIFERFRETPYKGRSIIEGMVVIDERHTDPVFILDKAGYEKHQKSVENFNPMEEM